MLSSSARATSLLGILTFHPHRTDCLESCQRFYSRCYASVLSLLLYFGTVPTISWPAMNDLDYVDGVKVSPSSAVPADSSSAFLLLFVDEPRQSPLSDAEKLDLVCNYMLKEIRD
jgi:hypothetical protein